MEIVTASLVSEGSTVLFLLETVQMVALVMGSAASTDFATVLKITPEKIVRSPSYLTLKIIQIVLGIVPEREFVSLVGVSVTRIKDITTVL